MSESRTPTGPDLGAGIAAGSLSDGGMIAGHVGDEDILLVRRGDEMFAVGAYCTHYHGSLADGLVVGDTVRCPLHHACFNLRTGAVLRAPALDPIACYRVERQGDTVFVREKMGSPAPAAPAGAPASVVIVGGGGAGLAAAETLRREGYTGPITMISADDDPPCDRPNLSKEYLSGEASEDWIPLRSPDYYTDNRIDLLLRSRVSAIDGSARQVVLENGTRLGYGALLIATGADPVHLPIDGAAPGQVHYLRSLSDSKAIIARAATAKRAVVIGASFIGLEVAASLRIRGLDVDVVAPDKLPLERILGSEVGAAVRQIHESHGVTFHLGETVSRVDGDAVILTGGTRLTADLIVAGVGVRPAVALAEQANLPVDRGIVVNEYLETSVPGIFAAGDVARWLDRASGGHRRVEHWAVAEHQGQVAARNILGRREAFEAAPFFWSQHYDVTIRYSGFAEKWDEIRIDGRVADHDCLVSYIQGGRVAAVATIGRNLENLNAEYRLESR